MNDEKDNINEEKKVEEEKKEEVNEDEKLKQMDDNNDNMDDDKDYVTREINLDDLYDGAINNTVVIDPITNKEVLMSSKKPNYTILGVILAIIILLLLYYINNKSNLGRTTTDVEPSNTTTTKKVQGDYGTLSCTYSSKSDAESQDVTYTANYENSQITTTNFNYVVISNSNNNSSAVIDDLKSQYETFFINNASAAGNVVSFESNGEGFTFNVETDYSKNGFNELTIVDGQTILYVKPSKGDTAETLEDAYTNKGFNCTLKNDNDNSNGE